MSDTGSIIAAAREKAGGALIPAKVGDFLAICLNAHRDTWAIYPVSEVSPDGVVEHVASKAGKASLPWLLGDISTTFVIGQHRLGDVKAVHALCWKRFKGLNALRLAVVPFKAP